MDVEAVAGLVDEGFRHERGLHALDLGDALHQTPQQRGMIGRLHRVGKVLEVDFKLAHAVFGNGAGSRNILRERGFLQCREKYGVFVERRE